METTDNAANEPYALGVNIGGAHITAAVVDMETENLLPGTMESAPVDAQGPAAEILQSWYDLIEKVRAKSPVPLNSLGMALPGPFNYQEGVSLIRHMKKYDSLFGLNIKEYLAEKLRIDKDNIRLRNNAEAFLAGEMIHGAARSYKDVIGVALGAGLGSARSRNGLAEDVNRGSSLFPEGIAEDYLSSRWFLRRYHELSGEEVRSVNELLDKGEDHKVVHQMLVEFSNNLAFFLGGFIQAEKPQAVIIGGTNIRLYDLVYPLLSKLLERHLERVEIRKAMLGEGAVVIGAVSYWIKLNRLRTGRQPRHTPREG
ncbi:ROK family protein [Paraflavisolibacter sp. H34]|uniref:ROK family protein n=1 Tax=Huijunlia imazamoxiresistens TaxID=3127457 RepID=UPI00301B07FF